MLASFFLFILVTGTLGSKYPQKTKVFDRQNLQGNERTIYGYMEDLSENSFDDRICSARVTGLWLFYENINFNGNEVGMTFFAHGDAYAVSTLGDMNDKVSSIRNSGIGSSYKDNSLNIYEKEGFAGEEDYSSNDAPYFRRENFGDSIIVTGCLPWTLYSLPYFDGEHVCVYPSDEEKCLPGFYPNMDRFPYLRKNIFSARLGCHSKKTLRGNSLPMNSTGYYDSKEREFKLF